MNFREYLEKEEQRLREGNVPIKFYLTKTSGSKTNYTFYTAFYSQDDYQESIEKGYFDPSTAQGQKAVSLKEFVDSDGKPMNIDFDSKAKQLAVLIMKEKVPQFNKQVDINRDLRGANNGNEALQALVKHKISVTARGISLK